VTRPIFRTKPGEALDLIERWIYTPALRELVEADGGTWPTGDLAHVVAELERFSSVWDKRNGQSRLVFKDGDESRGNERAQRVYAAAFQLGLLDSMPPTLTEVDHLLILGGLATGVEPRTRYAAELINSGAVTVGSVAALGSFRPLDPRERPAADRYAPAASFEVDLLSAMLAASFSDHQAGSDDREGDPALDPARSQLIRRWPGNPRLTAYASRSGDPVHRSANTPDTYKQFASDVDLQPDQSILIITSSIYRPYQHLDGVRILSHYGVEIETVGVPGVPGAGPSHPPSAYLQEFRSTIRSISPVLDTFMPSDPE
jgi:hypothetical protein